MATYINRLCPEESCPSHKIKRIDDQPHRALCKVLSMSKDPELGNAYVLECGDCGEEFISPVITDKRKTMSYSKNYYCASTDQTFSSYSEHRAFEKKHGLEPL